jgi:hypothetical protein
LKALKTLKVNAIRHLKALKPLKVNDFNDFIPLKSKFFLTGNTALTLKLNTIMLTKLTLPSSAQTFTRRNEILVSMASTVILPIFFYPVAAP